MSNAQKPRRAYSTAERWALNGGLIGAVLGVTTSLYDTLVRDDWMFGHLIPALIGAAIVGALGSLVGYVLGSFSAWRASSKSEPKEHH